MARIKISELPELNIATLDTTFVVGSSGSATYKIPINRLTSSLDTTFASDLVVNAVSGTINTLATTASLNSLSTSIDSRLDGLESFSSSADNRYVLSGSITQTTWDNISGKPNGLVSQSTDLTSLNSKTGSYATTGSNTFIGNQNITGSVSILIPGGTAYAINENPTPNDEFWAYIVDYPNAQNVAVGWTASIVGGGTYTVTAVNYQHPFNKITLSDGSLQMGYRIGINFSKSSKLWEFNSNGTLTGLPDGLISGSSQISDLGFVTGSYTTITSFNNLTQSFNQISQSFTTISGSFGDIDFSGINAVTESYLTFTQSYYSESASFDSKITTEKNRIDAILSASNASTDTFAEIVTLINSVDLTNDNAFASFYTASNTRLTSLENATSSYLTSLNGAISSSVQVLNGSGIYSSSAQLPSGLLSSSLEFLSTASYLTDSASFNSRIISGSAVAGTISGSSQIAALGYATTSSLNTLSSSVDSRLDTLETTIISGSPNYTQVLGNRRTGITSTGTSIISGSITTTGNPVQIMVTGDANPIGGSGWARLQIFRDGNGIGNIIQVENSSNLNVPYCLNVIDTPSAGTYTYSMRTVDSMSGTFDFGEFNGPLLTAVELRTNTNLPSTNNTFTGTNIFTGTTNLNGAVTIGASSGDEGGEILLAKSQTNNSLTGSGITIDSYQNRLRFFEQGGNARGAYFDITSLSDGVSSEILTRTSTNILATPIWTSAGTIAFGATTTTPTKGTKTQDNISYRQLGTKQWEVVMTYFQTANTGAANGSGDYLFTLPNSLSFDTTLPSQQLYTANVGTSSWYNYTYVIPSGGGGISNGATGGRVYPVVYNSTQFRILTINDSAWVKWFGSGHFQLGDNPYVTIQLTFRFTSA